MYSIKGSELGKPYVAPEHKGAEPTAIEGGKLYTGSCHCGRVTVAMVNKPIEDDDDAGMVVCNCSICERVSNFSPYSQHHCLEKVNTPVQKGKN